MTLSIGYGEAPTNWSLDPLIFKKGLHGESKNGTGGKPRMSNAPETHSPFLIANCLCWSSFPSISHFSTIIPDSPSALSTLLLPILLIVLQYEFAKSSKLCSNPFSLITKFVVIPDPLYIGVFMIFPCWYFRFILLHFWLVVPVCLHTTITSYPPLFGILGYS